MVYNADYADCNGQYELSQYVVLWAVERPVYRHKERDRFIFWNKGGLGWSIGKNVRIFHLNPHFEVEPVSCSLFDQPQ